jgi:hypothetical protein
MRGVAATRSNRHARSAAARQRQYDALFYAACPQRNAGGATRRDAPVAAVHAHTRRSGSALLPAQERQASGVKEGAAPCHDVILQPRRT